MDKPPTPIEAQSSFSDSVKSHFSDSRLFLTLVLIVFLGLFSYVKSFTADFQFDDYPAIVDNPFIKHFDVITLWAHYKTRFLTNFTFLLNYLAGGLDVFGWHLVNLGVHLASAFFVYLFTRITFHTPRLQGQFSPSQQYLISLFSALLFLVHPIQTQAVTYVVQRATSLAGFLYLAAMYYYVYARLEGKRKYYFWSAALVFLGIFTKPTVVTFPLTVILYEVCFFGLEKKEAEKIQLKRLAAFLPFILPVALVPLAFFTKERFTMMVIRGYQAPSVTDYFLTQLNVIMTYFRLLLVPVGQNLDYDYKVARSFFEFPTYLSAAGMILIFLCALRLFKAQRLLTFGILWFFIAIAPQSSFFPLADVIFEHRVYLACFGFSVFVCTLVFRTARSEKVAVCLLSLLIAVFAVLTYQRNAVWSDSLRFLQDVVAKSPDKARPHNNLGSYYLKRKMYAAAEREFRAAIGLDPDFPNAYFNLGMIYYETGRMGEAKTLFRWLVARDRKRAEPWLGLALIHCRLKDYDSAILFFKRAYDRDSNNPAVHVGLGNILQLKGDINQAEAEFKKALWLNPESAAAYYNLGNIYFKQEKFYEALVNYQKAISLDPTLSAAFNNTGNIFFYFGYYEKAIEQYQQAIRLDPSLAESYFNLANAFYAVGFMNDSKTVAQQAKELYLQQGNAEMAEKIENKLRESTKDEPR